MNATTTRRLGWLGVALLLTAGTYGCRTLPSGVVRHPAELEDGKLVICRLEYGAAQHREVRPQVVSCAYAILIVWRDPNDVPRLFVYNRPDRHVDETRSFDTFLELVDRLPHGAAVGRVNTCCAPISGGMDEESEQRLNATLERGAHRVLWADDEGDLSICTCESTAMRLPGDEPPEARASDAEEN